MNVKKSVEKYIEVVEGIDHQASFAEAAAYTKAKEELLAAVIETVPWKGEILVNKIGEVCRCSKLNCGCRKIKAVELVE